MSSFKIYKLFNDNKYKNLRILDSLLEKEDYYVGKHLLFVKYDYDRKSKKIIDTLDELFANNIFSNNFFYNIIKNTLNKDYIIQRVNLIEDGDLQEDINFIVTSLIRNLKEIDELIYELEWIESEESNYIDSIELRISKKNILYYLKVNKNGFIELDKEIFSNEILNFIERCI